MNIFRGPNVRLDDLKHLGDEVDENTKAVGHVSGNVHEIIGLRFDCCEGRRGVIVGP